MECKPVTGQSTSGNGEPEPLQIAVTWSPSTTVRLLWLTLISGRSEKGIQRRRKRKICYPMFLLLKVCIHQSRFHPFHKTHHNLNNLSVTPYLPNTSSSPLFPSATGLLKSALITALSTLGMLYHWDSNGNWSDTTPKRFFLFKCLKMAKTSNCVRFQVHQVVTVDVQVLAPPHQHLVPAQTQAMQPSSSCWNDH